LFRGQHVPDFADKILIYYDILYCNPNSIKNGDTVYCDTHQLLQFKDILNQKNNLTIITHNSDFYLCDGDAFDGMGVNVDLFTCFKKWYAQNSYSNNKSVIPIPIGFENKKWEKIFGSKTKYIRAVSKLKIEPTETMYFNCNLSTNMSSCSIHISGGSSSSIHISSCFVVVVVYIVVELFVVVVVVVFVGVCMWELLELWRMTYTCSTFTI
jgi:hypothetical protein